MRHRHMKDSSVCPAGRKERASLTVETAAVLPVFLVLMISLTFFFRVMLLQMRLQESMEYAVSRASVYVWMLNHDQAASQIGDREGKEIGEILLLGGVTAAYLEARTITHAGADRLDASPVVGGSLGLNPLGSALPDDEGNLDFVLHYRVRIPFLPGRAGELPMTQRVCRRIWGGTEQTQREAQEEPGEEEQMVFITSSGTVYHISRDCSHLRFSTEMVSKQEVGSRRNNSGEIYRPCERCAFGPVTSAVYITGDGNRFHTSVSCPGLTRTIKEVPLSQAGDRRPCRTCGGAQGD